MEIFQNDLFGNRHLESESSRGKPRALTSAPPQQFRQVCLEDGLDEAIASGDSMLIHRILQKKILYQRPINKERVGILLKVLHNEMSIKSGKIEPSTASRDSLLAFYAWVKNPCAPRTP
jgi:hypothetical protein